MREYISTIVDCDHSTGDSANVSAPATAPPKARIGEHARCPASPSTTSPTKSRLDLHISIAVHPAAIAPNAAEQRLTHQAGVGCPMYVTHENALQKSHEQNVQNGYPGGCGTPRFAAAVASSPESSRPTLGPRVKKYTANETTVAVQNAAQSNLVKNLSFIPSYLSAFMLSATPRS